MIYFVDQTSEGEHHLVFNSSMIKIIFLCFPNDVIKYYGLASGIAAVKTMLTDSEHNVTDFCTIKHGKINRESKWLKGINYVRKEIFRVSSFLKILNGSNNNDWIILSITTFTSFLWFKILKIFYKTNTIAVLHGEVTFLYNAKNNLERFDAFVHKLIFKIKAPCFYYLTLNKIEKEILVRDGYLKSHEIIEIEHPFSNLGEKGVIKKTLSGTCLTIGHLGTLDKATKNSHFLFNVAEKCKAEVLSETLSFKAIGLMTKSMIPYINPYVHIIIGNDSMFHPKYLPREIYEKAVNELDYSIFFYPPDEYIFRASGAIADTIAKVKPIICLAHPIFEYMFKHGGDIGFICKNKNEMIDLIKNMGKPEFQLAERYKRQVANLLNFRKRFEIESVATDLKTQIFSRKRH